MKTLTLKIPEILEYEKYEVDEAVDGQDGIKKLSKNSYDIALCDIKMPKMDGIEMLEKAQEIDSNVQFIMISAHGSVETAVEAVKKGAYDFIQKPPDLNRLLITLRNALDKSSLVTETKVLKKKISETFDIIGESLAIKDVKETILTYADL